MRIENRRRAQVVRKTKGLCIKDMLEGARVYTHTHSPTRTKTGKGEERQRVMTFFKELREGATSSLPKHKKTIKS